MKAKSEKNYVVIGGQYERYSYGFTRTLLGAKRLATANMEYWDNWQGWHYPAIYKAEDVEEIENFYGSMYAPKVGAIPVATRCYGEKWREEWE